MSQSRLHRRRDDRCSLGSHRRTVDRNTRQNQRMNAVLTGEPIGSIRTAYTRQESIDLPPGAPTERVRSGWFDTVDLSEPHRSRSLRKNTP